MPINRVSYVLVVLALVVAGVLTVRQAVATTQVVSAAPGQASSTRERADSTSNNEALQCPFSDEERRTLRAVYLEEAGIWVPRTDQGYTGYEGGLLALRFCR